MDSEKNFKIIFFLKKLKRQNYLHKPNLESKKKKAANKLDVFLKNIDSLSRDKLIFERLVTVANTELAEIKHYNKIPDEELLYWNLNWSSEVVVCFPVEGHLKHVFEVIQLFPVK